MHNLYELDVQNQLLQIFDIESRELTEEIFLTDRIYGVTTVMSTSLREECEEISNGIISKRVVDLPSKIAPFTVHLKEGSLMIFWSPTLQERDQWIRAFKSIVVKEA